MPTGAVDVDWLDRAWTAFAPRPGMAGHIDRTILLNLDHSDRVFPYSLSEEKESGDA